jgi:DNA mismatch repair protein MutL
MSRIRQLDAHVVNQIAAGEVIDRPASVVKELLENSVDALATRVEVDVVDGGSELIRVVDDGEGVHPDDLLLSVSSHATSKLNSAEDLFRVRTLGFRGEALASIASVSRFHMRTRQPDAETGYELQVRHGEVQSPQACGCPVGTSIEVHQLFANTPVRRKFLKTTSTEFGHITEQFTRVALANPRLHAVLRHNGKTVYELPATDALIDRLRLFYGRELAENLIQVESESEAGRLWGYVAHPSHSKSTRKGQYLFLNGRWIQDRSLQHALSEAYRGLLMTGRHPIIFLFLELAADDVDVNVHPTKNEVRFRDSQQPYRQLLSMLRTRFLSADLDGSMSVADVNAHAPSSSTPERKLELQHELADWAKGELASWTPDRPPVFAPQDDRPVAGLPGGTPEFSPFPGGPQSSDVGGTTLTANTAHAELDGPHAPVGRAMQIHDCYLIVETGDGMTVIDQHALHERIMYEHLRRRVLEGAVESQKLLVPETVDLSARETSLLLEHQELLQQLGFTLEEFGGNTILLTAYPVMLARADLIQVVRDMAEQFDRPRQTPTRRDTLDELLHMMSCKAAIKAGQRLSNEEMESLLAQRHLIDDAHHCPHGRPTALVLSRAELDRQFGRLG